MHLPYLHIYANVQVRVEESYVIFYVPLLPPPPPPHPAQRFHGKLNHVFERIVLFICCKKRWKTCPRKTLKLEITKGN